MPNFMRMLKQSGDGAGFAAVVISRDKQIRFLADNLVFNGASSVVCFGFQLGLIAVVPVDSDKFHAGFPIFLIDGAFYLVLLGR